MELRKQRLPEISKALELAAAIGIDSSELSWLCYHRGAALVDHYTRFAIPKRSGKTRIISSPKPRLRVAQSWVNAEILDKIDVHRAAFAFRPKRSIADNAYMHCKKAIVIRMDLQDFFPSVTFPRIRGIFRSFGYNDGVATMLALLCSEAPRMPLKMDVPGAAGRTRYVALGERQLPQGACTSPALSNIVCRRLDKRLAGFAKKHGWTYTRYADDLVFSHADDKVDVGRLLGSVGHIIRDEDFRLNDDKTRVMRAHQRQTVTGLLVQDQPRVTRRDMRRFRAFLHQLQRDGVEATSERIGGDAMRYTWGYLCFIRMVNLGQAEDLLRANPWLREEAGA